MKTKGCRIAQELSLWDCAPSFMWCEIFRLRPHIPEALEMPVSKQNTKCLLTQCFSILNVFSYSQRWESDWGRKNERERWIRDPCGPCTDVNELWLLLLPISSSNQIVGLQSAQGFPLNTSSTSQTYREHWLLQHQWPINLRTHTNTHTRRSVYGEF